MKKKIIHDNKSRPWVVSNNNHLPYYDTDPNINNQLMESIRRKHTIHDEIQDFIVVLPFYSYSMWLKHMKYIKNVTDYSFCTCCICGQFIMYRGVVCLCFTVVQLEDGKCEISWNPRLSCCHKITSYTQETFFLSHIDYLINDIFLKNTEDFDDLVEITKDKCYVCDDKTPCTNDICLYILKMETYKQTANERFYNLINHFKEKKTDIFIPLLLNKCANDLECNKKMSGVKCTRCRTVAYCSYTCKDNHEEIHQKNGCIPYLKIWELF